MTGYAHVFKYNPNGINQYTKGNGDASSSGGAGGAKAPSAGTTQAQKDDLTSAHLAGYTRQEQAKNFITALS